MSLRRKEEKENNSKDVRFMHQIQTQGAISIVTHTHTKQFKYDFLSPKNSFFSLRVFLYVPPPPYISE